MIWRLYLGYIIISRELGGPPPYTRWFGSKTQENAVKFLKARGLDPENIMLNGTNVFHYRTRDGSKHSWPDLYTAIRGAGYAVLLSQ